MFSSSKTRRPLFLSWVLLVGVVLTGCSTGQATTAGSTPPPTGAGANVPSQHGGAGMMGGGGTSTGEQGDAGMMGGSLGYHYSRLSCSAPRVLPGQRVNVTLADMGMSQMMGGVAPVGSRMMLQAGPAIAAAG